MNRSVMIHGSVLAAALLAAYLVWTREPSSGKQDEINILSFHTLDSVTFDAPRTKVTVQQKRDDYGTYHWVRIETERNKPPKLHPHPAMTTAKPHHQPNSRQAAVRPGPRAGPPGHPGHVPMARPTPMKPRAKAGAPGHPGHVPMARPTPSKPRAKAPSRASRKPGTKGPASLAQDPKANPDKPKAGAPVSAAAKATRAKAAPAAAAPRPTPAKAAPAVAAPRPTPAPAPGKTTARTGVSGPAPGSPARATAARAAAAATPKEQLVTEVKVFVANKMADDLFKTLATLPAARALGSVSAEKLKDFGLAESKTTLTIVSGSTTRKFRIGDRTYGNLDYYVQDMADKRVYVLRQDLVEQLKNARSRLYTANLHDFALSEVERVVVNTDDKKKALWQHDRTRPGGAYWTDTEDAQAKKGKDVYRNWIGKVDALRVKEYTDPKRKPAGLKQLGRLEYYKGGEQLGWLTLSEKNEPSTVSSKPGASPAGKKIYYAQSEHTRVPVEVYSARAEEVVKGLADLLKE